LTTQSGDTLAIFSLSLKEGSAWVVERQSGSLMNLELTTLQNATVLLPFQQWMKIISCVPLVVSQSCPGLLKEKEVKLYICVGGRLLFNRGRMMSMTIDTYQKMFPVSCFSICKMFLISPPLNQ